MKRYKCGYCNHETAQRGNCKQHVKKSHPGQPVIVEDLQENHRKLSKDYSYKNIQVTCSFTCNNAYYLPVCCNTKLRRILKFYSVIFWQRDNVEVQSDVSAAKWSNIGEAENFAPPPVVKRGTLLEQDKFHNVVNGLPQMVHAHECNINIVQASNIQLNNETES